MDMTRLSRGEQIVGGAGIVLLLLSFFPLWAKYEIGDLGLGIDTGAQRGNAWSAAFNIVPKLALIFVLVAVAVVIIRLVATDVRLPVPAGQLYLGLSGAATALLLIALLMGPQGAGLSGFGFEVSRGPVLLIAWVLGAAMAYGGYMHWKEEQAGGAPGAGPGYGVGPTPPTGGPTPPPPPPAS